MKLRSEARHNKRNILTTKKKNKLTYTKCSPGNYNKPNSQRNKQTKTIKVIKKE